MYEGLKTMGKIFLCASCENRISYEIRSFEACNERKTVKKERKNI